MPASPRSTRPTHEAQVMPRTGRSTRLGSVCVTADEGEGIACSWSSCPGSIPPYPIDANPRSIPVRGYSMHKDDYRKRLARIEGQVRGLARMIDEEQYCIDVLTQIASVTRALQGVGLGLLDEHLGHCVREATDRDQGEGDAKITEAV